MEAPTPWRPQATVPRYSLHDLQAACKSSNFQPGHMVFHSMEQQMPSAQPDTAVLLICLASAPTGNRSLCCRSDPASDEPCPLWLHPRVCAASWSCELGHAACTHALSLQLPSEVVPSAGHASSCMPRAPASLQGHQANSLRSSEEFPADKENQQVLPQQQQPDAQKQGSRVPGLELLSDEQLALEAVYALQASGRLLAGGTAGRCVLV